MYEAPVILIDTTQCPKCGLYYNSVLDTHDCSGTDVDESLQEVALLPLVKRYNRKKEG